MLIPNIIQVTLGTQWIFTFEVTDPYSGDPASKSNVYATFKIFEAGMALRPLWSCAWDTGIQEDTETAGELHVFVPGEISDFIPSGMYTYELCLTSKDHDTYVEKYTGAVQAVPVTPVPKQILGETDPVATKMVEVETKRAMEAEEALSERISALEAQIEQLRGSIEI